MVTTLSGTPGPVPVQCRFKIMWGIAFPEPEIVPDPFQVISCHEEPVRIFEQGNTSHRFLS